MKLLSRKSSLISQIFNLNKVICTFSYQASKIKRQHLNSTPMKPYQKLLAGGDIGQLPKLPSVKLLNDMRTKQIAKIMFFNHELNHDQVFESQIECFYSIITRFEPSAQCMSLLLQQVYKNLIGLHSEFPQSKLQAQKKALIPIMKPSLLSKLLHITEIIEPFYNEYLKMMIATFVVRATYFSESSKIRIEEEKARLNHLREEVYKEGKQLFILREKVLPEQYEEYFANRQKQLVNLYPSFQLQDFLQGSFYVIKNQYYTQDFLEIVVNTLLKQGLQDEKSLDLTISKIKLLGVLNKFETNRAVLSKKHELFQDIYNQNVKRYFKMISDSKQLLQITNSKSHTIQLNLVISEFLNNQHFKKAKELYLNIFNQIFDTINNGCLLSDIRKFKGVFQVLIIMFNYRDTKKIHQLLKKVEKTIVLYPFARIQKFQSFVYVCQKFGYKSDTVAQKYFNSLSQLKQRLASLKGIIPHLHHYTRQLNLSRKFLTYLQIIQKGNKAQIQLAHKYCSQLFDPNIWYCFSQNQINPYGYFTTPSFTSFLFFTKISVDNLTTGFDQKKKIALMAKTINLSNNNKKIGSITDYIYQSNKYSTLKMAHCSFRRHNHHSRMLSTLKLAVHHYQYLNRKSNTEATSFIEQFLQKSINNPTFYNLIKSNLAYPGIFDVMLQIMQYINPKKFSIQSRDIYALKRLFSTNLQKLKKMQESQLSTEIDKIKYQLFLDAVELNIVYLPYQQDFYGLRGISLNLLTGLTYDSMIRYKAYKQNIRMQIQTFCKFKKQNDFQVKVNYFQYPHIADVFIKYKEKAIVILIKITDNPQQAILNSKQIEMQKNAEQYWRKKGFSVIYLWKKKQIQEFVESRINHVINRLQIEKI